MGRLSSLLIGVISGASAAYYLSTEQGKKVTKKVVRFVKDYQEDPQEVHESVKQTAKDVSKQAAEVIQQTKEKSWFWRNYDRNCFGICQRKDARCG